MFKPNGSFSSFSVNDVAQAKEFHGQTSGLAVEDMEMGILQLTTPEGQRIMIYPKDNHEPATFTVLNLVVDDVDDPNLPQMARASHAAWDLTSPGLRIRQET